MDNVKLFIKILFFILTVFQTNIGEAQVVVFDVIGLEIQFAIVNVENKCRSILISENEFGITCKKERDLVEYRNLVLSAKVTAAKRGVQYSDDLVKAAQQLYPKKAGLTELHHIAPKYLGGAKNGALVPLDGAYHQVITNEFRSLYQYGLPKPGNTQMLDIMKQVYSKYPLPPGY